MTVKLRIIIAGDINCPFINTVAKVSSQPVVRITADGGPVDDSKPHTVTALPRACDFCL